MPLILAIESSCDDTSVAILRDTEVLSSIVYTQSIHQKFNGVVPELASRSHENKISVVLKEALSVAKVTLDQLEAVAVTQGPGLIGSLIVGVSFAKGLAISLNIPLIGVNHIHSHILSSFIENENFEFPLINMTVSGGHTQLFRVDNYLDITLLGSTIDDAAGECFDKCSKVMGLGYPGGPIIDKKSQNGDENRFEFSKPKIDNYNFSFSGLKTSFLYFINKQVKNNPNFVSENINDLCASIQKSIVEILINKLEKYIKNYKIKTITLAGGVSANSRFRQMVVDLGRVYNVNVLVPSIRYCTDNAAMIGYLGYHKFINNLFDDLTIEPFAKNKILV